MNKTSGFLVLMKDETSDLLNFRRFASEFAFQQQIERTVLQSAPVAGTFEGTSGSCSRTRFSGLDSIF
jgi:hypothetical protein